MTRAQWMLLCLIPLAYLLGSVPFGLLIGLARGIDVREAGSGNIGATNVGRLLGGRFFALVFVLDLLKGLVPVLAAGLVIRSMPATHNRMTGYLLWLGVAFAAIAGHMFSLFLRFKGGKGVATSCGVILGLYPYFTFPAVIAIAILLLMFKLTRYISVASMIGAVAFVFAYVAIGLVRGWDVFGQQLPLLVFASLMAALIVYKHRGNVARLRAGTEPRFGRHEGPSPA